MILKIKEEWRELHSVPLSIKCVSSSLLSSFLSVCQSVPEENNSVNTVVSTTPSSIFYHGVVPTGSPSCGGDVAVYVLDIKQPSLPTPFHSVLVSYDPFIYTLFHKFSRQLSAFSLCSSGLISALLVLSTVYLFMKVFFSSDVILCG